MMRLFVKLLPTTLRDRLLIYLIVECCKSGSIETADYLCRSMMLYLYNIPKQKKMRLFLEYKRNYEFLLHLTVEENW